MGNSLPSRRKPNNCDLRPCDVLGRPEKPRAQLWVMMAGCRFNDGGEAIDRARRVQHICVLQAAFSLFQRRTDEQNPTQNNKQNKTKKNNAYLSVLRPRFIARDMGVSVEY